MSRASSIPRRQKSLLLAMSLLLTAGQLPAHQLPSDEQAAIDEVLDTAAADNYRLSHADAHALLKGIEWTSVDRLRVEFDDNLFEPEDIYLKKNRPYRITLVNVGFESHDIIGELFFSSFVVKKVRNRGMEIDAHHLERLLIRPKEEIELWLVPVRTGELDFVCTIPGHYEEGMAGHLVIRD